ncbi:MAG: hypothetical protein GY820_02195, partial [Gammaproteobacteria bacterium]|nr:hypothetical protein [Gammaproteobacteria bacterium]
TGVDGSAIEFDASDTYMTLPSTVNEAFNLEASFEVKFDFKTTSTESGHRTLFSVKGGSSAYSSGMLIRHRITNAGAQSIIINVGDGNIINTQWNHITANGIENNTWYTIRVIYDAEASTITGFVDQEKVVVALTDDYNIANIKTAIEDNALMIGCANSLNCGSNVAIIDNLTVYFHKS